VNGRLCHVTGFDNETFSLKEENRPRFEDPIDAASEFEVIFPMPFELRID